MAFKNVARLRILQGHLFAVRSTPKPSLLNSLYTTSALPDVLKTRKSVDVHGSKMSYLDTEVGDNAVVFLHGNPTSAYLWRNVIPHVQGVARCLAPDLIGMGHSDKLPSHDYSFANHFKYLDAWFETVDLPEKVTVVGHDWGSGLGFHWCHLHQNRVRAIVHMESLVGVIPSWHYWPDLSTEIFQALRTPSGEGMVLQKNLFVELLFPKSILRVLDPDEMSEYRLPYINPGEDRRPTLTWAREIPVETDGPADVVELAHAYNSWLSTSSSVPKLFIDVDPGFFSPYLRKAVAGWPNQKRIQVKGLHFAQEDSPEEIGKGIAEFLKGVYK